ncbi:hypothetical protein GUJ93_ZPchr0013g36825 [Zizania palustris]|uniref:Uncharacterized protein n=1 Tax=Zizania palustris TaxID=103762 RepID=A0A8J5X140_ZIZPA|nr:hypothetical protein GUJ93_ZPchr0013g36825 [Zizania palustris]
MFSWAVRTACVLTCKRTEERRHQNTSYKLEARTPKARPNPNSYEQARRGGWSGTWIGRMVASSVDRRLSKEPRMATTASVTDWLFSSFSSACRVGLHGARRRREARETGGGDGGGGRRAEAEGVGAWRQRRRREAGEAGGGGGGGGRPGRRREAGEVGGGGGRPTRRAEAAGVGARSRREAGETGGGGEEK